MIPITIYTTSNGKITRVIKCPSEMIELQRLKNGESRLVGVEANPETQYVSNGKLTTRTPNTASKSGEFIVNIPEGSVVRGDDGTSYSVVGSAAQIGTDLFTVVRVFSPWPTQEAQFEF